MSFRLILASGSPRRVEMLKDLSIKFKSVAADIDESVHAGERPDLYVQRLSFEKAVAVAQSLKIYKEKHWAVLGADTTVVHQGKILGKPENEKDAFQMLKSLSGKTHLVITGYTLLGAYKNRYIHFRKKVVTKVTFSKKPDAFWKWYVSTKEPMDKAGAYGAQGRGVSFISQVQGSYSNVVGLPLSDVLEEFENQFGESLVTLCRKSKRD